MTLKQKLAAAALAATMSIAPLGMGAATANADVLGKVLLGAGGILLVKATAKPLNNFIDNLMLTNHVANRGKTKVVPMVGIGTGVYVGAAQVSGPAYAIDRTQAVAELTSFFGGGAAWHIDALIPVDKLNVLAGFKRVYGVGVDAIINARL